MLEFQTERIAPGVTRIHAFHTERMYLVEGSERAALIDTGSGFGHLRAAVEALTSKPVIVLLTHGHGDHAMGAGEFDTVYLNHRDDEIYRRHGQEAFRRDDVRDVPELAGMAADEYIAAVPCERFRRLADGMRFDLGGVSVEACACPGHTPGMMAMLIPERRILLAGDACNSLTFLFDDDASTLSEYARNLAALKARTDGRYDRVLSSHGCGESVPGLIDEMILLCADVRAGRTLALPFVFKGVHGLVAREIDFLAGHANLVYNGGRL